MRTILNIRKSDRDKLFEVRDSSDESILFGIVKITESIEDKEFLQVSIHEPCHNYSEKSTTSPFKMITFQVVKMYYEESLKPFLICSEKDWEEFNVFSLFS